VFVVLISTIGLVATSSQQTIPSCTVSVISQLSLSSLSPVAKLWWRNHATCASCN